MKSYTTVVKINIQYINLLLRISKKKKPRDVRNSKLYESKEERYQNDVFLFNIELQVEGNTGSSAGLSARTVWFGTNEINGNGELDLPDQVSQEQESASGHAHNEWRGRNRGKIGGDLRGEFGDSFWDLELGP